MTTRDVQRRETHLIEVLLSGLDARESARAADAPMLVYLADMVVERARIDLANLRATYADRQRDNAG